MAQAGQTANEQRYSKGIAITTSDATVYNDPVGKSGNVSTPFIPDAFYVGVTGDVTIVDMGGNTTLLKNCVQGQVYPFKATMFKATGTTATNLIALYW